MSGLILLKSLSYTSVTFTYLHQLHNLTYLQARQTHLLVFHTRLTQVSVDNSRLIRDLINDDWLQLGHVNTIVKSSG